MENINVNAGIDEVVGEEAPKRRKRRTKEEIEADRLAKEQAKAEREAARAAKLKAARDAKAAAKDKDEKEESDDTSKKKKKGNGQKPIYQRKRGAWSNPKDSMIYEKMFVELELLEPALGTSPNNKELLAEYIASRAPDAASREEEIAALGEETVTKKQMTVFMRGYFDITKNGQHYIDILDRYEGYRNVTPDDFPKYINLPYFWNYQLRGFFKDSCGLLSRGRYGESADMTAYKKVIDGNIFVRPRRIAIDLPEYYFDEDENYVKTDPQNLPVLQRPLRAQTPQGEITALASSVMIPAGSRIKFCIQYTDPKFKDPIVEWLNYGAEHGLGAWRNSGRGAFRWREIQEDWSPFFDEDEEVEE